MPALSPALVLDLWERAEPLDRVGRGVVLAASSEPRLDEAEVSALPIGRRDARLLRLHVDVEGPTLDATATCPACAEQVEFASDAGTLLRLGDQASIPPARLTSIEVDGYSARWRCPDSRDLAAAAATGDALAAERVLLTRCVTITGPDGAAPAEQLPPSVRAAVTRAMADADPLAEVLVELVCPTCRAEFVADLDVFSFVWAELRARARRVLREVHVLARAYGWTESDVLALSEQRRAEYLRLVAEGSS
jgi:hypothetical protein